jgi:2-methylisocitrate lyase-like PEP mutase family enzyme
VIFPISTVLVATAAMRSVLAQIKHDGTPINVLSSLLPFNDFLDFIGLPEIRALEQRFAAADNAQGDGLAAPEEP